MRGSRDWEERMSSDRGGGDQMAGNKRAGYWADVIGKLRIWGENSTIGIMVEGHMGTGSCVRGRIRVWA